MMIDLNPDWEGEEALCRAWFGDREMLAGRVRAGKASRMELDFAADCVLGTERVEDGKPPDFAVFRRNLDIHGFVFDRLISEVAEAKTQAKEAEAQADKAKARAAAKKQRNAEYTARTAAANHFKMSKKSIWRIFREVGSKIERGKPSISVYGRMLGYGHYDISDGFVDD